MEAKPARAKEPKSLELEAVVRCLLLAPTSARMRATQTGSLFAGVNADCILEEGNKMIEALLGLVPSGIFKKSTLQAALGKAWPHICEVAPSSLERDMYCIKEALMSLRRKIII